MCDERTRTHINEFCRVVYSCFRKSSLQSALGVIAFDNHGIDVFPPALHPKAKRMRLADGGGGHFSISAVELVSIWPLC